MRTIALISIVFGLTACQPQQANQAAQKQHFVCKSLIEGFLKTQNLAEYQLDHLEPTLHQTAAVRNYRYHTSSDQRMKISQCKKTCSSNAFRQQLIILKSNWSIHNNPVAKLY